MKEKVVKKAKCPGGCGAEYQWSWCQDTFVLVGGGPKVGLFLNSTKLGQTQPKPGVEVRAWACLNCGKIIGFSVTDDDGHFIFNHPDWEKIDWEKAAFYSQS